MGDPGCLTPDWPVPPHVKALVTTRLGGSSNPPFHSNNLAFHVGDDEQVVSDNWCTLERQGTIPVLPQLVSQVHGKDIIKLPYEHLSCDVSSERQSSGSFDSRLGMPEADGLYTQQINTPCTILTADCLPVLLCDKKGTQVAALHAGWRGLAAGVICQGIDTFESPADVMAYLGPAICAKCFEVGAEVVEAYLLAAKGWGASGVSEADIMRCFQQVDASHWKGDLYGLAELCLRSKGVTDIYCSPYCTVECTADFYSFRAEGTTGRFASMIWLTAS